MERKAINLAAKLAKFSEHWSPKVIAQMNDYQFKRMRAGALPWMDLTVTVLLNVSLLVLVTCGLVPWAARRRAA